MTTAEVETYTAVPMAGLVGGDAVPFPLYLCTGASQWVLYQPRGAMLDEGHLGRLKVEGVSYLYVRVQDRRAYFDRVESELDAVLRDRNVPLRDRADLLHGLAVGVADDLLGSKPNSAQVQRARKVMMATSGLLLREDNAFQAVRKVLSAGPELARHSLTVGFLSMGLWRVCYGGDAASLAMAGLAGLLHDVGRIGHEELDHDPEHTDRGAQLLRRLGLPGPVVAAAQMHHECLDGSGYPNGIAGADIPDLSRLVALLDLFDGVYTGQEPKVGVFEALRVLAQTYRGCFDERLAQGLVRVFR
ncbi:MAG: HD-GYP domain-containing protein [Planctomycetota bacterium]